VPTENIRTSFALVILFLLISLMLWSCSKKLATKDSEPVGPAAAVQTKSYKAVGKIVGLDPETPAIEIDHEDIPGLMPAMQMDFHLAKKELLDGLKVGDRIEFTIENGVGGLKVTAIRKIQ
jgi:Cu/Ag efflux protein CusF